jgi:hypothetical protein
MGVIRKYVEGKILGPTLADDETILDLVLDWTIVNAIRQAHILRHSREKFVESVNDLVNEFWPTQSPDDFTQTEK